MAQPGRGLSWAWLAGRALSMVPAHVCEAGRRSRTRRPQALPTLWAAPSPLVVGGEDATARRVVAVLGLPRTRGAALVLAVGGGGRHGVAGVRRRPQRERAQAGRRGPRRSPLCKGRSLRRRRQRGFINQGRAQRFLKAPGPGGVSAEGLPRPKPSQIHPSGKDRADPLTRGTDAPPGLGVGGGSWTDDGTAFQRMQVAFIPPPDLAPWNSV